MTDEKVPCFKRGVDPEGNPWCDFQGGHDGLCSDHADESMGRFVVWRESDVDDSGNVRPLAVSDVVNPPGESSGSDGPRITSNRPDPIRCATRCSQWPTCRHDWSPWRCQVCEAVVTEGQYCEDHSADEDTGPVVVEEIAWSRPCPAPLRCADQEYCPPACRRAGNREGNKAGSAREYGGCSGCECGQHDWLDRPESDTRECLICGAEVAE